MTQTVATGWLNPICIQRIFSRVHLKLLGGTRHDSCMVVLVQIKNRSDFYIDNCLATYFRLLLKVNIE